MSNAEVDRLVLPLRGATVGQAYFSPCGVGSDGVAWVILIARDDKMPRQCRQEERFGLIAWRWNMTATGVFSLTLTHKGNQRPHVRWMGDAEGAVAQAIRRTGRLRVQVIHPGGARSGWFEGVFSDSSLSGAPPSLSGLEYVWSFPLSGIRYSKVGVRFDPLNKEDLCDDRDNEIPLWPDPSVDLWYTLDYDGPWSGDLEPRDMLTIEWALCAHRHRERAAGFIQVILERQALDGTPPLLDAQRRWWPEAQRQAVERTLQAYPALRDWIAAIAGPEPDAHRAHEAALKLLCDQRAIFEFANAFMRIVRQPDDEVFNEALKATLEAALVDARITAQGRRRPWLANLGESRLQLRVIELDMTADREDLGTLWRAGLQFGDLLDAGLWFGPRDLPAPLSIVNDALESVRVEGSIEEAQARVITLLQEAQEARQWSVPWGARIQIDFGPFVAMRIFEKYGEFACLFLDEQDRYLHVAIGLAAQPPRVSSVALVRKRDDDGEMVWNDDAEVSLQLIAAAIVRDFLVVENRESVFTTRPLRRRVRGRDERTVVYLPRVRYGHVSQRLPGDESGAIEPRRSRHAVGHHLRRATSASAAQRFLAQRYGVELPQGFTFVRPHERGVAAHEERIRIYRSRSASRMIFQALQQAPEGARPAWFDFERDCGRLLAARGMRVVHQAAQRDGDGGVDLFAVQDDNTSWVVQCKCWAPHRKVGPDVVRELVGAIAGADRGSDRPSRGMILTTSTFTPGAVDEARKLGFVLLDGATLARELRELAP